MTAMRTTFFSVPAADKEPQQQITIQKMVKNRKNCRTGKHGGIIYTWKRWIKQDALTQQSIYPVPTFRDNKGMKAAAISHQGRDRAGLSYKPENRNRSGIARSCSLYRIQENGTIFFKPAIMPWVR